ncbi:hypothetical protein FLACOL_01444 [Flavobacterium columnare]|uniref:YtkA-like domain-containing protein n=3 Tax=Flavobacterium TaxID=237 RepID=A0A2N9PAW1_9FLAO|nr:FixH family protein [Flavobacterium columnare]RVU89644.1 hypothetical protein EH230_12760 [Flavobacterium columnare]SPE77451.1 hypothetical protein FLACOL_01444 [Flavobacterium columnare]
MKFLKYWSVVLVYTITSCTLEKTDYEAEIATVVTEYSAFREVTSLKVEHYNICIESLNGTFYKGYNEIRVKVIDSKTNKAVVPTSVSFLPIMISTNDTKSSCPHQSNMEYKSAEGYFAGYSVFTDENDKGAWQINIKITINNQLISGTQTISVFSQDNKNLNMTTFIGNDGEKYYIALIGPKKPKVSENELIAGIYRYNQPTMLNPNQYSFTEVKDYTLKLDPRMPEPSMGNHSSPNNKDLTQEQDGFYHGVVNYTMTGNWTLNLILLDTKGKLIKGSNVPKDFTPGVQGFKSDLFMDILF